MGKLERAYQNAKQGGSGELPQRWTNFAQIQEWLVGGGSARGMHQTIDSNEHSNCVDS